jgi:ribosomal protein L15E
MKTIKSRTRGDPKSSKYIGNSRVDSSNSSIRDDGNITYIIRDASNKGKLAL